MTGGLIWDETLRMCIDSSGVRVERSEIADRNECKSKNASGYSWQVPHENCDNVIFSLIALFQIATFEGWMEVISYAQDSNSTSKYQQPEFASNSVAAYVFSYLFIIIGSFFFNLNIFT